MNRRFLIAIVFDGLLILVLGLIVAWVYRPAAGA